MSFCALVPVPNLSADIDWDVHGHVLRDQVVDALDRTILPNLKSTIRSDFWMTPQDFKNDYLTRGCGLFDCPHFPSVGLVLVS